jgi:hypothetical protein
MSNMVYYEDFMSIQRRLENTDQMLLSKENSNKFSKAQIISAQFL